MKNPPSATAWAGWMGEKKPPEGGWWGYDRLDVSEWQTTQRSLAKGRNHKANSFRKLLRQPLVFVWHTIDIKVQTFMRIAVAIPTIPDAAVGAVAAASIGGLLAFLGLVIAKENKTSEFRQMWIDAIRQDLAKMIASANAIRGADSVGFGSKEEQFKAFEKHFVDINQAVASIRLRLNQDEAACKPILDGIERLEKLMIDSSPIDIPACRNCEKEILAHARKFLKNEWKRVRRGEPTFFITKWIGLALILGGVTWLFWTAVKG